MKNLPNPWRVPSSPDFDNGPVVVWRGDRLEIGFRPATLPVHDLAPIRAAIADNLTARLPGNALVERYVSLDAQLASLNARSAELGKRLAVLNAEREYVEVQAPANVGAKLVEIDAKIDQARAELSQVNREIAVTKPLHAKSKAESWRLAELEASRAWRDVRAGLTIGRDEALDKLAKRASELLDAVVAANHAVIVGEGEKTAAINEVLGKKIAEMREVLFSQPVNLCHNNEGEEENGVDDNASEEVVAA